MPTYDYICDSCHNEFEAFESITAPAQSVCPKCSEPKLRRKIGPGAAILFKGSGFYQTDYRSDSYKKRAEADKPSSSAGSESKSSESKPAAAAGSGGASAPKTDSAAPKPASGAD